MNSNAIFAAQARIVDLDVSYKKHPLLIFKLLIQAKTLGCDPLPDVERETDLNTFITQWKETDSPDLESAALQCQVAENVIRSMQDKLGEARAMYL